jgi:four helix bundle protein
MNPKTVALQERTRRFHTSIVRPCEKLPKHLAAQRIAPQLLDSAGSTVSNYRAACRARSSKEFIAKICVAAEEADESQGWLQALLEAGIGNADETKVLIQEADELTAIFVASEKTARRNAGEEKKVGKRPRNRETRHK